MVPCPDGDRPRTIASKCTHTILQFMLMQEQARGQGINSRCPRPPYLSGPTPCLFNLPPLAPPMPPVPPASPPALRPPSPLSLARIDQEQYHSATIASVPPEIAARIARSEARAERSKRRGSRGVELPENDVRRQIGCRLMNLGNSCYQNCILQILVNLPDVRQRLVEFAAGHTVGKGGPTG